MPLDSLIGNGRPLGWLSLSLLDLPNLTQSLLSGATRRPNASSPGSNFLIQPRSIARFAPRFCGPA